MTFKELRKRVDLTCEQVSVMIGIRESSYRKYECSSRVPKADTIVKLKHIFQCTDEEIVSALNYHTQRRNLVN